MRGDTLECVKWEVPVHVADLVLPAAGRLPEITGVYDAGKFLRPSLMD